MNQQRVVIVGAGIVGLAHAWHASKKGHSVTVVDRQPDTREATVRNFGMVWPIGQPPGNPYQVAKRSRDLWLELASEAHFWCNPCGSIHLAHRDDEWQVLQEFEAGAVAQGIECKLLTANEVVEKTPAANPQGLLGGLFSPTEMCVNPRRVPAQLARFLQERYNVKFHWNSPVVSVASNVIKTAHGLELSFDRCIIASGSELNLLFPEVLAKSELRRCKLHMLKTVAQQNQWRIGPHLASGLTLRHYKSFAGCPSLPKLIDRIEAETPELNQFGIHVMASQNEDGEVILGDSHEYGNDIQPFQPTNIDDLIMRELRKILSLPDWTISQRWEGIYAKHPTELSYIATPVDNVLIHTGFGGAGMTLSLGITEQFWLN
ncbi:MAG: TIGR03364 family FAD-dependent oxidoreductase [Zavarzinella sp.]